MSEQPGCAKALGWHVFTLADRCVCGWVARPDAPTAGAMPIEDGYTHEDALRFNAALNSARIALTRIEQQATFNQATFSPGGILDLARTWLKENPRDITQGESARSRPPLGGENQSAAPSPIGSVTENLSALQTAEALLPHVRARHADLVLRGDYATAERIEDALEAYHQAIHRQPSGNPVALSPSVAEARKKLPPWMVPAADVDALIEAVRNEKSAADGASSREGLPDEIMEILCGIAALGGQSNPRRIQQGALDYGDRAGEWLNAHEPMFLEWFARRQPPRDSSDGDGDGAPAPTDGASSREGLCIAVTPNGICNQPIDKHEGPDSCMNIESGHICGHWAYNHWGGKDYQPAYAPEHCVTCAKADYPSAGEHVFHWHDFTPEASRGTEGVAGSVEPR